MSDDPLMPDDPSVPPVREVERLMKLAVHDQSVQGPMFRVLLAARLWVPVPPHPELMDHAMEVGAPFSWCTYQDAKGKFVPVFTSEEVAEKHLAPLPAPAPMIVELPAKMLFAYFHAADPCEVRVFAGSGVNINLSPEALAELVQGHFTESDPRDGECRRMTLRPVREEDVPSKLRQAIRVFCVQRQGAMAVYALQRVDDATREVDATKLHLAVRLRDEAGHFYNDFRLMAARMAPKSSEVILTVVRGDDAPALAFLERCTPLWPVMGTPG